jgi:hypothetical protein
MVYGLTYIPGTPAMAVHEKKELNLMSKVLDDFIVTVPGTKPAVLSNTLTASRDKAGAGEGDGGGHPASGDGSGPSKEGQSNQNDNKAGNQPPTDDKQNQQTQDNQDDKGDKGGTGTGTPPEDPDDAEADDVVIGNGKDGIQKRFGRYAQKLRDKQTELDNSNSRHTNLESENRTLKAELDRVRTTHTNTQPNNQPNTQPDRPNTQQQNQPQQPVDGDGKPTTARSKVPELKLQTVPNFKTDKDAQGNPKWATYGEYMEEYIRTTDANTQAIIDHNQKLMAATIEDTTSTVTTAIRQQREAERQEEAARKLKTDLDGRIARAKEEYGDDFTKYFEQNVNRVNLQANPDILRFCLSHDRGIELALHLAKNPAVAAQLFAMDPSIRLAEAGVILAGLPSKSKSSNKGGANNQPNGTSNGQSNGSSNGQSNGNGSGRRQPAKPLPKSAQTGTGGNSGVGKIDYATASEMDPDEYIAARKAGRI